MSTAGTIYEVLQNHNSIQPGVLRYVSTTQLRFDPVGSNRIKINGVWRPLPAAGITTSNVAFINGVANQNLAANTNYYAYAFWDGTAVKMDFSTTGHSASVVFGNVGVEIKTGDESRTLVGYVRTSGDAPSAQFRQTLTQRYVRSWFNRHLDQSIMSQQFGSQVSTGQTAPAFSSSSFVLSFLLWAGESFTASFCGAGYNDAGYNSYISFWWDGAATAADSSLGYLWTARTNQWAPYYMTEHKTFAADGYHTLYQVMWTAGGTFYLGPGAGPYIVLNGRIGFN